MRPIQRLAFAEYAPDAAPYLSGSVPLARNTVPRPDGTDGPLRGPTVYSEALASECRGAFSARDRFGTTYLLAGTADDLWLLVGASWVSKGKAGGYAVPDEGVWSFTQFGDRVVATNDVDPPQIWLLGDAAAFDDIDDAPIARYVASVEPGFVMLGRYDSGAGVVGGGLSWSAINDATMWPSPGTLAATSLQRDVQELPNGGAVMGIVPAVGNANAVILTERALYRVEYAGPPAIFAFREVDRSRGCICPQGIAQVGAVVYFVSEDGFCAFDGSTVAPIGLGKLDRTFFATVDMSQLHRVFATVDLDRKLVIWAYPAVGATVPRNWLIYNYATQRWRAGLDDALSVEAMFPARTPAIGLDQDDAFPDDLDAPGAPPLDSAIYMGGRRIFAGFDPDHRLVTFDGPTLAARLETQDTDSTDGRRIFVSGLRLLTDAPTCMAGVGMRERLADPVMYGAPTSPAADGFCPQRVSGRYGRAVVTIPAAVEWTYLQAIEAVLRPEGRR